jgi:hypothetical protein
LCGAIAIMTANVVAQVTVKTDYAATKYAEIGIYREGSRERRRLHV